MTFITPSDVMNAMNAGYTLGSFYAGCDNYGYAFYVWPWVVRVDRWYERLTCIIRYGRKLLVWLNMFLWVLFFRKIVFRNLEIVELRGF